jgi:hypothetical protein
MTRARAVLVASSLLALVSVTAAADPAPRTPQRVGVYTPSGADEGPAAAVISNKIFVNRCVNGCTFTQSSGMTSSSRLNQTWLGGDFDTGNPGSGAPGTVYTIPPCTDPARVGSMTCDDAQWADIVACVVDTYAPYDVVVTDVDPGTSVPHHEAVAAGVASDLGLNMFVGGVGPISGGCALHEDTVSFSFDIWPNIYEMCSTIAQETGHGFGIEHSFNCQDAMGSGYVNPSCGPQYFRNETLPCADESKAGVSGGGPRACICGGGMQNVHNKLLDVFGLNPTPLPAPETTLVMPTNGQTFGSGTEFPISVAGNLRRGLGRAEVWFNGYKWMTQDAQRNQIAFNFTAPPDLPDGVIDVEVRVYNDLETVYGTATATVTKGSPCVDETSCAAGQHCDAGKCSWDAPAGQLGDACDYPQYCVTGICEANQCSSDCVTGIEGFCPAGFSCVGNGDGANGFCLSDDGGGGGGGCCSTGSSTPAAMLLGQLGLVGIVLGGILRRRRRR